MYVKERCIRTLISDDTTAGRVHEVKEYLIPFGPSFSSVDAEKSTFAWSAPAMRDRRQATGGHAGNLAFTLILMSMFLLLLLKLLLSRR